MFSVLGPRYGDIHGCRGDKENSYLDGSFRGFDPTQKTIDPRKIGPPGWLGYRGDEILSNYIGIIIKHYKDPY